MTLETVIKGELMARLFEDRGVPTPTRPGWTKISCINDAGHARGDRNPSASVNMTKGYYRCFACGIHGDAYDILQQLENLDFPQAVARLGEHADASTEPVWYEPI